MEKNNFIKNYSTMNYLINSSQNFSHFDNKISSIFKSRCSSMSYDKSFIKTQSYLILNRMNSGMENFSVTSSFKKKRRGKKIRNIFCMRDAKKLIFENINDIKMCNDVPDISQFYEKQFVN